jgi:hypothetical protein
MTIDAQQEWFDEAQKIANDFVQNDTDLGLLMLDCSQSYWDRCFDDGLTPQQALDKLIKRLQGRVQQ